MSRSARSRYPKACALLVVLHIAARASGQVLLPPDPSITIGKRIRFDGFVDENGQAVSALLSGAPEREARPWIVSPMYTRCPHTCSAITAGLRSALGRSGLSASSYRVLSFSFDPHETDDGLRRFRARLQLPSDWLVLRAGDPQALERTLAGLDFRTLALADGGFEHPNLVAVLTPDLRLSGYLFGVSISPAELRGLVQRAAAGVSAADTWRPYVFFFALLGFLGSAAVFAVLLARRGERIHLHGAR